MKHGSLFSGIGGFDLAAEWAGWSNEFHCEISEFPRKILNYYWPKSKSYEDIKKTDFTEWRGRIDVISGGFPCQPYSTAGKRLGKEDDRHLWPEMLRVIREVQPRWVVGENVFGLVNWSGGLVFDEVQSDLEAEGYEVQAYVLPACGIGAPHRRDRVWFVAHSNVGAARSSRSCGWFKKSGSYKFLQQDKWRKEAKQNYRFYEFPQFTIDPNGFGINRTQELENCQKQSREWRRRDTNDISQIYDENRCSDAPNPKGKQSEWMQPEQRESCEQKQWQLGRNCLKMGDRFVANAESEQNKRDRQGGFFAEFTGTNEQRFAPYTDGGIGCKRWMHTEGSEATDGHVGSCSTPYKSIPNWHDFPTKSPICSRDDGISFGLDGITFSKWRSESLKGYGNAIVPQVAYQIFKTINEYEKRNQQSYTDNGH